MNFILLIYIWNIVAQTAYKINEIIITENEIVPITQQSFIVPINDLEEIQNLTEIKQNLTLFNEIKRYPQNNPNSSMYIFQGNKSDNWEICFYGNNMLHCNYSISNYISDEDLIIIELNTDSIDIQQEACKNIHQIEAHNFILQCEINQTTDTFLIINSQGQVLDSMNLLHREQCLGISRFQYKQLLFFEKGCTDPKLLVIRVDVQTFSFDQNYDTINYDESLYQDLKPGKLIDAIICSENMLIINFEYQLIYYNLNQQIFNLIQPSNKLIIGLFSKCTIQLSLIFIDDIIIDIENDKIIYIYSDSEKIQQNSVVNNNLIQLIDKQIFIKNNQYLQTTLPGYYTHFRAFYELPFIVCQTMEGQIIFYKINQYQKWLKYMNSTYLAIYEKHECTLEETPKKVYKTQLYDLNNPQIYLIQNETYVSQNFGLSSNKMSLSTISTGLPLYVGSYDDPNQIVSSIKSVYHSNCKLAKNYRIFKILYLDYNHQGLIFVDELNQITILDCQTDKFHPLPFLITQQILDIYTKLFKPEFVILAKDQIYYIGVDQNFEFNIILEFKEENLKMKLPRSQFLILFQNCTIISGNTYSKSLVSNYQYYNYEQCTRSFEFQNLNLFVNESHIIYKYMDIKYKISLEQIISADLDRKRLLVFQLTQGEIKMKLYQLSTFILLLYDLPTYNYTIVQPLQYSLNQQNYFTIAAFDEKGNEFLLVYNIYKDAFQCLELIIPIDKGVYQFGYTEFDGQNYIWFAYENKIMLQSIKFTDLNFEIRSTDDVFQKQFQIQLHLTSRIECKPQVLTVFVNYINDDNQLRFKTQVVEQALFFDTNDNNSIQNLSNIFGAIYGISSKQVQIQPPIIINSQEMLQCQFFFLSFCYNKTKLYYDSLGSRKLVHESNFIRQIIYVEKINENEYNIYYIDILDKISVIKCSIDTNYICSTEVILNFDFSHGQIKNINGNIIEFSIGKETKLFYFQRNSSKWLPLNYRYVTYIGTIPQEQDISILLFVDEEGKINFYQIQFINVNQTVEQLILSIIRLQETIYFQSIVILSYNLTLDNLLVEFLISENVKTYLYIYEIIIDLNQKKVLHQEISNYIRLGFQQNLGGLLIYNEEFLIYQERNINSLIFFDISMRKKHKTIDPIYEFSKPNVSIKKIFNQTHYALVSQQNGYEFINLLIIDKYRIICQSQCESSTYNITLTNNVSNFSVSLIKLNFSTNSSNLNQKIIITNLIIITLVCLFKKPKKQARKNFPINIKV